MKRNLLLSAISGMILIVSFQNCSQGSFESSKLGTAASLESTKTVISDGQIQDLLDRRLIYACPAIRCMALPDGCEYQPETNTAADTVKDHCPSGCGNVVCKKKFPIVRQPIAPIQEPILCPEILCSEVPDGCRRVASANTVKDVNGCNLSCGDVVCEDKSTATDEAVGGIKSEIRICPTVMCAAPPVGCFYRQNSASTEKNACPGCGELICKRIGTELPPVPVE